MAFKWLELATQFQGGVHLWDKDREVDWGHSFNGKVWHLSDREKKEMASWKSLPLGRLVQMYQYVFMLVYEYVCVYKEPDNLMRNFQILHNLFSAV